MLEVRSWRRTGLELRPRRFLDCEVIGPTLVRLGDRGDRRKTTPPAAGRQKWLSHGYPTPGILGKEAANY
jgi:hypothetical protein